jgi:hypothetical protein
MENRNDESEALMNTERERFEEWWSNECDDDIDYCNRNGDNIPKFHSWLAWQHQAATIADLQHQLTYALEIIELKITEQGYTSAHDRRLQEVLGGG